jgi:hypothetical protein
MCISLESVPFPEPSNLLFLPLPSFFIMKDPETKKDEPTRRLNSIKNHLNPKNAHVSEDEAYEKSEWKVRSKP